MGRRSNGWLLALISVLSLVPIRPAGAGAWPMPAGETLAILKFEDQTAHYGDDAHGARVAIPSLDDQGLTLWVEHGLTRRLTLQGSIAYTRGQDAFIHYDGRGPIALALRYAVIDAPGTKLSLLVGGVYDGVGRNAGYALPHQGNDDVEARVLFGQAWRWRGRNGFVDLEAARLKRDGLPDETHLDATLGVDLTRRWQVLLQSYSGRAEQRPAAAEWVKTEAGVVRRLGRWSLQAGWRTLVAGRNTPADSGPVLAIWRRF